MHNHRNGVEPLEGMPHISAQKQSGTQAKLYSSSTDGPLIKQQIELKNGRAVRISNKDGCTNQVLYYRYHGLKGVWLFLIDTLAHFENIIALFFIIVHYISQEDNELTYFFQIVVIAINILAMGITNVAVDMNLKRSCIVINKKEVQRFTNIKKKKKFEPKYWETILPGDIIKINENEEFPADVLILDVVSNVDHNCYVVGGQNEESSLPVLKRACEGTQNKTGMKMSNSQFIEQISGVVKFEFNYNGFFQGTFKLINNPAAFNLSIENIAPRGSYLCQTKGVICLVLNVGHDCIQSIFAGNKRPNLNSTKNPYFPSKKQNDRIFNSFRIFQILMISIYIVIAFIVVFQSKVENSFKYYKFISIVEAGSLTQDQSALQFIESLLSFIAGLSISLPLSYKIVLDLIALMNANFTEWDYNNQPASVKYNQGIKAKIMGQINHLFISKQSLMSHNVKKVKVVKIREVKYEDKMSEENYHEEEKLQHLVESTSPYFKPAEKKTNIGSQIISHLLNQKRVSVAPEPQNSNLEDETNHQTLDEYLPNCITFKPFFKNESLKKDLHSHTNIGEIIQSFFKALVLCHQASRRKTPNPYSKSNYKSIYSDEQAQLMFAESYGYSFISRKPKNITIQSSHLLNQERFDVMVLQSFYIYDARITVIVIRQFQNKTACATLYMKGAIRAMREFISYQSFDPQDFELDIKNFAEMGLQPLIFAKKELNEDESSDFERKINEALGDLKNSEDKIINTVLQYSFELEALGIIGVQEIYNLRDSLVIQDAIRNGVKVWMLTRDEDILQYEITYLQMAPLIVNGESERDIEEQMKTALKAISEQAILFNKNRKSSLQRALSMSDRKQSDEPKTDTEIQKRVLIFDGISLFIILKDEQLTTQFLTLSTLCDFVIGCSVTPSQKQDLLKAVKEFGSYNDHIMSIISSAEDQKLILDSDVSIAINARYKQSDALVMADIIMKDFYPLTYILFKHGSLCHRRLYISTCIFIYRALLISIIQLTFMGINGFSAVLPLDQLVYISFLCVVTPLQIFLVGISYKDVGYDHLHRIYGEYKGNQKEGFFNRYNVIYMLINACFDAALFYLYIFDPQQSITIRNGRPSSLQGMHLYFALMIHLIFTFQLMNFNQLTQVYYIIISFLNLIGLIFILDDDYLVGIKEFSQAPQLWFYIIFTILLLLLRNFVMDVIKKLVLPTYVGRFNYYKDIEDKLYLEEYEDPNLEFNLKDFAPDHKAIESTMLQKKRIIINKNMLKLHRSDSMDQIIEKINKSLEGSSDTVYRDSSMMNWITLKFNDQNKEIEYNEAKIKDIIFTLRKILVLCSIFASVELIKEVTLYGFKKIPFVSFYYYFGLLIIFMILALITYRVQNRVQILIPICLSILCIFYCFNYFYMVQIEFTQFISITTIIFMLRGISMNIVILIGVSCYILQINLALVVFKQQAAARGFNFQDETNTSWLVPFLALIELCFVGMWAIYIYWAEKQRKLDFWVGNKKIKEFTKLKSILNLLLPPFVRERIRQGHRFIADDQGDVTIIFCDIADFDKIVQMYSGRELIELLDHIYNALDQLCEQHGLQKVETVGKTYMACGGLKIMEKKIDQRLLSKHHVTRITDFAFDIQGFMHQQSLKDGTPLKVKIGIHSGNVISGVVGENKPQFSLIGDTVNKSSRVCSKCESKKICLSKESYRLLELNSNQFTYDAIEVEMKGIGTENIYSVHKKRVSALQSRMAPQLKKKPSQNNSFQNQQNHLGKLVQNTERAGDEMGHMDSSRSMIYSDHQSHEHEQMNESSERSMDSVDSNNDSFQEGNFIGFGDMKDDRQIAKNPVENSQYNMVERPNYLMVFKDSQQEKKYLYFQIKAQQFRTFVFLVTYFLLNKLMFAFYVLEFHSSKTKNVLFIVLVSLLGIYELVLAVRLRYLSMETAQIYSAFLTLYFVIANTFISLQALSISHDSRLIEVFLIEVMITIATTYFVEILFMKQVIIVSLWSVLACVIINVLQFKKLTTHSFSYFFELLFIALMHVFRSHAREMSRRRIHNREKMIDVEIKKTSDLLGNLVPPPVLNGIKSDQKVVDELEDCTLLFTDMVGFTHFSNNVKNPKEVVKLLSDLFTRFDQLCVNNHVYKVHTIGDCYVISGYTGHIPVHERTEQIKAEEAFKVVQTAFEMIEIISEIRNNSDNSDLKELNMRIGVHTGKIVAGIIGTKIVRYDIFGQDVLIANKMESNGLQGQVVVSQFTKEWLESQANLSEKLEFEIHKYVELESVNRVVEAFIVRQRESTIGSNSSIRMNEGENGEDSQEYDYDSEDDANQEKKQS